MNFTKALQVQEQLTKAQSELEAKLLEVEALEAQITALRDELGQTLQQEADNHLRKLYSIGRL